ncbi:Leucyl aminopeptidase (aminopeptidase T) [Lacrimispora sphenoides]|jgi:leucyl aminopeptidase (aminopeptidase T)|uniref:aminopeptidase n=1 Tax=Lacrimispora sphenoides TaxID=29370 RepID=UPI0008B894FB|nr:aminopeptidase [Lacrimispora sphenoides]SEU26826.1 Leucyl aminopeptidase (aminopeptidase T) [Lacrimispora sphenoides]
MDYQMMFQQENENIKERFDLSMERIGQMASEQTVPEPYRDYFIRTASFIAMMGEYLRFIESGDQKAASLEILREWNQKLYQDILPGHYEESYANPAYAVSNLGEGYGQLLSYLYKEIRGDIVFVHEWRLTDLTILNETLIEIYNVFEEEIPEISRIKEVIYWFVSDYTDHTVTFRVREGLDPTLSFATDIIRDNDLNDLRYLYYFGEYISESELKTAEFLNSLPEETVRLMADTYTEGYRKGFEVMGRDLKKKGAVQIRYELGFERMVKYAMENFEKLGLQVILCRAAVWTVNTNAGRKNGYYSTSPNRQYVYDHRYDDALYLNKAFKDRKAAVLKVAYETYKEQAAAFAGPAVMETFGKEGFEPVNKPEANRLDARQEKLSAEMSNETSRILNQYVPGDETSFTIIAFPVPEIGEDFEKIFEETIAINTLDYEKYKAIQQAVIDVLDEADYVEVTGKGNNKTHLKVALHPLNDRDKETKFENCVADVNIPLGEVFTSPRLTGTEGTLAVSTVYITDFQFKDLVMTFENGMIKDYSCSNFEDQEEGKALVKQVILKNQDTLPMGEFAIGTNTTAYAMARKFGILDKLPILIVEKMGPHFAVGDTCYSWAEDSPVYNPNGKEIIARDNEVSILRKEDVSKAYFSCHTDITIPYAELDRIEAVTASGKRILIIDDGRFVLKGTEELNIPLANL